MNSKISRQTLPRFPNDRIHDIHDTCITLLSKMSHLYLVLIYRQIYLNIFKVLVFTLTLMFFQTHMAFVHLWNTNEDFFNEIWELSVLPLGDPQLLTSTIHLNFIKQNKCCGKKWKRCC